MKKKLIDRLLCLAVVAAILAGCGNESQMSTEIPAAIPAEETAESESLEGTHIFMFKSNDNSFGATMYEGFAEYMAAKGEKTAYKSPAETTVSAQVEMLDELIEQKVASITISTNGNTGYEEVFKKAQEAGIPIISVDSEADPEYRVCHINQAETADVGAYLVQAAVLITLGIDYPGDGSAMKSAVEEALANYSGEEIALGVLSASVDTPVQNAWIAAMEEELGNACYTGKVSPILDIKYGNDDFIESVIQANEFLTENEVDCIISPTTIGIVAAGQVLGNYNSEIRLTGFGLPSEMQSFMPSTVEDDAFGFVCPYMMLWDVIHLGATAGAATYATVNNGFTGEVGTSFEMDEFRGYEATSYNVYQSGEGTAVVAGVPYIFYKNNMAEWVNVL